MDVFGSIPTTTRGWSDHGPPFMMTRSQILMCKLLKAALTNIVVCFSVSDSCQNADSTVCLHIYDHMT